MRSSSAWSIVAATLVLESSRNCDARKWFDVADATIYLRSAVDPGRIEYSLERDPFDFRPQSTAEPTIEPQENDNSPTASPSLAPTAVESDSPTSQPSPRYMFVVGNGGCNTGRSLFEIRMVDSWGDGWGARMNITEMAQADEEDNSGDLLVLEGEASASISQSVYQQSSSGAKASKLVFSGGLYRGDEGYKYVCLDALKCYSVEISAGTWTDEIKWEIRKVKLGVAREDQYDGLAAAKGLAPVNCRFSLPNKETNQFPCPVTCGIRRSAAPTSTPSKSPTAAPS